MTASTTRSLTAEKVGASLFAEHGFSATTTRELSRSLGITNGTFYHHYASKEALLVQICRSSLTRITSAVSEALADVEEPVERLKVLISTHVREMVGDQDLHKTMLIELRSLSGENLEGVTRQRDEYGALVQQVIIEAQSAGVVRSDIDSHTLELLLLNLLNWTIFWYIPDGDLSIADLADATTILFFDGVLARDDG